MQWNQCYRNLYMWLYTIGLYAHLAPVSFLVLIVFYSYENVTIEETGSSIGGISLCCFCNFLWTCKYFKIKKLKYRLGKSTIIVESFFSFLLITARKRKPKRRKKIHKIWTTQLKPLFYGNINGGHRTKVTVYIYIYILLKHT